MQAKTRDILQSARDIGFMTAVACLAALNLAGQSGRPSLHLGDILAFQPTRSDPVATTRMPLQKVRFLVHRVHQFGCVLDLDTIRHIGGSLIIEGRTLAGLYHLHWAGERTSTDSADCGRGADLILDANDLERLAAASQPQSIVPANQQ